jgi:hypothetical protein
MTFRQLYDEVQTQNGRISTRWLRGRAIEYSSITRVVEQWSGQIDGNVIRGFYIEGPIGRPIQLGPNEALITLARSMCTGRKFGEHWRRFVYTKELMHVFDEDAEKTDTPEKFDTQISRLREPGEQPPQLRAEHKAVWRALALLCPEKKRLELKACCAAESRTLDECTQELCIPPSYMHGLLRDNFAEIVRRVL